MMNYYRLLPLGNEEDLAKTRCDDGRLAPLQLGKIGQITGIRYKSTSGSY
jgi:hypothetical protein